MSKLVYPALERASRNRDSKQAEIKELNEAVAPMVTKHSLLGCFFSSTDIVQEMASYFVG
jgi:hypothetical protein